MQSGTRSKLTHRTIVSIWCTMLHFDKAHESKGLQGRHRNTQLHCYSSSQRVTCKYMCMWGVTNEIALVRSKRLKCMSAQKLARDCTCSFSLCSLTKDTAHKRRRRGRSSMHIRAKRMHYATHARSIRICRHQVSTTTLLAFIAR